MYHHDGVRACEINCISIAKPYTVKQISFEHGLSIAFPAVTGDDRLAHIGIFPFLLLKTLMLQLQLSLSFEYNLYCRLFCSKVLVTSIIDTEIFSVVFDNSPK